MTEEEKTIYQFNKFRQAIDKLTSQEAQKKLTKNTVSQVLRELKVYKDIQVKTLVALAELERALEVKLRQMI